MRRRDVVKLLAGTLAAYPSTASTQSTERLRRIGMVALYDENDPAIKRLISAFELRLRDLGWEVGKNIEIDYRFVAGDVGLFRMFTNDMVESHPDVIVTNGILPILVTREKGGTIPVVFMGGADLVGRGISKSWSHPEGNVTGFINFEYSIIDKWIEFIKRMSPGVARVGLIFNIDEAPIGGSHWMHPFEAAAASFSVNPIVLAVHDIVELEKVLAEFGSQSHGGLVVAPDPFTIGHHTQIIELASRYRIPGCYPYKSFAVSGGLMSYGPNDAEIYRQMASYVDRILRGAHPSDLPIQRPDRLELVINLKTAKALDLTVPVSVLARADELIE